MSSKGQPAAIAIHETLDKDTLDQFKYHQALPFLAHPNTDRQPLHDMLFLNDWTYNSTGPSIQCLTPHYTGMPYKKR